MSLRFIASVVVATCLFAVSVQTAHAAPLRREWSGPAGFGANVLPINDDGSSAAIDLTTAFVGGLRFFGGPYSTFYVNNNGNITFSAAVRGYTPIPFPVAAQPMIAPYWGDVDTRGGGAPARNGVYWHLAPGLLVVTWHNVGYFNTHDDRQMSFQLIISNASGCGTGDFDVEFRYEVCGWTTGDASGGSGGFGGTPAQAGFDAGHGTASVPGDVVEIPGSRTMAILDVCRTTNVPAGEPGSEPGIWRFSVRGGAVSCPGAGEPCDTGAMGACGVGVTQCIGAGISCSPIGVSTPERCDNIDNDCDGMVDDGDALCTGLDICVAGACITPCFEGGCADGYTCGATGSCIETSCIDVSCPAGQRCAGGACVGACEGIVCPHSQQCVAGRCVDLCDVLTCGTEEVCVEGACVPQCPCRPCGADESCSADGSCTPNGCDLTICDPGFYCVAGACLDACAGVTCPSGQHCETGECIEGPPPMPDGGVLPTPDGGMTIMGDDSGIPEEFDGGTGMTEVDGGRRPPGRTGGCGCSVPQQRPIPGWAFALLALGVVAWRRRRS